MCLWAIKQHEDHLLPSNIQAMSGVFKILTASDIPQGGVNDINAIQMWGGNGHVEEVCDFE